MPDISQLNIISVTVQKFLDACSPVELQEVDLLIQSRRYQDKMNGVKVIAPEQLTVLNSDPVCQACGVPDEFHGNRCGWANAYRPPEQSNHYRTYMQATQPFWNNKN